MNRRFEQRVSRLEQQRQPGTEKKPFLPQWLLDAWHESTGLPFDTRERALASLRRMQQPDFRRTVRDNDGGPIQMDGPSIGAG